MKKLGNRINKAYIAARNYLSTKKEGSEQLIVMFIIIAVAAGIAGLLYLFVTGTLLPDFETSLSDLIDDWFNHV